MIRGTRNDECGTILQFLELICMCAANALPYWGAACEVWIYYGFINVDQTLSREKWLDLFHCSQTHETFFLTYSIRGPKSDSHQFVPQDILFLRTSTPSSSRGKFSQSKVESRCLFHISINSDKRTLRVSLMATSQFKIIWKSAVICTFRLINSLSEKVKVVSSAKSFTLLMSVQFGISLTKKKERVLVPKLYLAVRHS